MSHFDIMVKLHVYLFQTKMTIRKIPSPVIFTLLSQKSSFVSKHFTYIFHNFILEFLSCWHKVQHFIDTQQDFLVVCMLILFIDFHCPFLQKERVEKPQILNIYICCLLYTSPSPRDGLLSRMPSSA